MVREKKRQVASMSSKGDEVRKGDITENDLLSQLIKANMASDVDEDTRMSEEEVVSRESGCLSSMTNVLTTMYSEIPSILLAGYEVSIFAFIFSPITNSHGKIQNMQTTASVTWHLRISSY